MNDTLHTILQVGAWALSGLLALLWLLTVVLFFVVVARFRKRSRRIEREVHAFLDRGGWRTGDILKTSERLSPAEVREVRSIIQNRKRNKL